MTRCSAQAQKALVTLREAEHVTDDMRDGQLRLSREAAELADRADRGEAVDADELSGIDKDRQLLWNGLQSRDANDDPEDIKCIAPWEQLHKYWSLRIAALRDKFGQLHGWRDEARRALERRDAPLVSVLEDLLSRGAALQQKMTSRRDRRGIMDACDSLRCDAVSARYAVAATSSSPSEKALGGLFFDFEPFRGVSRRLTDPRAQAAQEVDLRRQGRFEEWSQEETEGRRRARSRGHESRPRRL